MLDGLEKASLTWRTLEAWLLEEIVDAQMQNEQWLEERQTAALRARIATLREILTLAEPTKPPPQSESVPIDAR